MGLWQGEENAPGDARYTYDTFNRLTSAFKNGVQEEYTYTADGLRAGKKINYVGTISENGLRLENGLNQRISYRGW